MRFFKLLEEREFWPHVPLKPARASKPLARWLPRGTILIEFFVAHDDPSPSPHQITVEVLEGEFKGYQRYAQSAVLGDVSPLEFLAEAANEAL